MHVLSYHRQCAYLVNSRRYSVQTSGWLKIAYLIDTIPTSPLDSVVSLPPSLDLVEGRLRINGLLVQDVDSSDIVGLARLELIGGVFPQNIIQLKRHSLASVVATRLY